MDVAMTDVRFDLTASATALTGTSFDAAQIVVHWLEATEEFRSFGPLDTGAPGSIHTTNLAAEPNSPSGGTLVVAGSVATLTIPIQAQLRDELFGRPGSDFTVYGEIVATAPVPEPAAGLLVIFGAATLAAARRSRRSPAGVRPRSG
jgi:hypothetical protein